MLPGTSGILTPFSKIEGLYFDHSDEPDDELYILRNDITRIYDKEHDIDYVNIKAPTKEEYYDALNRITKINEDSVKVKAKYQEEVRVIIEDPNTDQKIGSRRNDGRSKG